MHEDYVDRRPSEERDRARFNLLIAVATAAGYPLLFSTEGPAINPVDSFECVGGGRHLGRHILEPMYNHQMSVDECAILAIQALAAAKERVDGVGGKSQFLAVRNGFVSAVVPHDVDRSEPMVLRFQSRASRRPLDIGDPDLTAEQFEDSLRRFGITAKEIRDEWAKHAAPWRDLIRDLSRPGVRPTTKRRGARPPARTPKVQPSRPPTTNDL